MSHPDHAPPPLPPPLPLPPPRGKLQALESSPQPPPPLMMMPPSLPLYKQRSWSPDIFRDEAWLRRKGNSKNRRSKSVTDEDLDELKACIELGFGFDSPEVDQRLSDTLPALGLYYAVNKNYNDAISKSASSPSVASDCESIPSPVGSPHAIFGPDGEDKAEAMGAGGCLFREAKHMIRMMVDGFVPKLDMITRISGLISEKSKQKPELLSMKPNMNRNNNLFDMIALTHRLLFG